jgi:hypothetical protein
MIQLFINDKLIELGSTPITQTAQLNDLGEPDSKQTSHTNNIKIPDTPNNREAIGYLTIGARPWAGIGLGWKTIFPYGVPNCKLVEDGIELVSNGFAVLSGQEGSEINIAIYGAEKSMTEKLRSVTLKDCFPSRPFTYTATNFRTQMDSNTDYIFALAHYNDLTLATNVKVGGVWYTETVVTPFQMTPQFYVRDLINYVFSYLGYTIDYPTLNGVLLTADPDYTNLLVTASRNGSGATINIGSTVDMRNFCPETIAYDLVKDFMNRFFLLMEIDERKKRVRFVNMDHILLESDVVNYSDKFDSVKRNIYKVDKYGQKNFYKYSDDKQRGIGEPGRIVDFVGELEGSFDVRNLSLETGVEIYESPYNKPTWPPFISEAISDQQGSTVRVTGSTDKFYPWLNMRECTITGGGSKVVSNIVEKPVLQMFTRTRLTCNTNNHRVKVDFLISNSTANVSYFNILQYVDLKYSAGVKPSGTGDIMSFQKYINKYYRKTADTLYFFEGVEVLMNWSTIDFYKADLFKRVYIEQLGGLYYMNKISNYRKGALTPVELIRISPYA